MGNDVLSRGKEIKYIWNKMNGTFKIGGLFSRKLCMFSNFIQL